MYSDMDKTRVKEAVAAFLQERFDIAPDRLSDDVSMRELGLDSIMMLDVMLDIEDRLGLKMTDLAMPVNPKLADIVALVQRNISASRP